ncbi:MAG TPA: type III pantothenate kinase [Planctomycetota bacterium]
MPDATVGLLTVACGNSTLDCFRHDDAGRVRLDSAAPDAARLSTFLRERPLVRCVAVSVVPNGLQPLAALLLPMGVSLQQAGIDLPCPLPLAYETPHTLGADRWVAALAAYRRHGRAVVVDCGSATTVNLVEADGTFHGGAIAPGLRAFALGLAVATPALPAPRLDAAPSVPSRSSQAAVDTGVLIGWCGLVERLVADTLRAAAGPAQVVVTGGNAERLRRHTRLRADFVPDLLHEGLRLLAGGGA